MTQKVNPTTNRRIRNPVGVGDQTDAFPGVAPQASQPRARLRNPVGVFALQLLVLPILFASCLVPAVARTSNGNDFALYFSEAKDNAGRKDLLDEARGRPHFFRYLQIMEMETVAADGRTVVTITAFEPASRMDVRFTVSKAVSLSLLRQEPASKRGKALAVTGKVMDAKWKENVIQLGDTIIRHKDRLSPKIGKELLCEVNPNAVFYNYTAGSRPVTLTYRDRDLIRHKERIIEAKGADGWVEFLEQEVARRKKERETKENASK